ncbi:quinone oxidoreductase, putative [Plasmodium berghei]|uniref:Quinone oxidoreductase, putative n=2 Tax=Plasmodium berghei TaxID=5821 RepID=A0A509AII5_PLABA|nr:quinone oxidoreductase, putative [Plasmodium berghei ANKA]CXI24327.1 quinone oxidoreductase, putative [Plasmodium berghei]SCM20279.1 quinone oxidoreductase, putative [Plasmodium berghei]SCN23897.1 quinone oxidoreductase, putative [Plasmodium berghei]SCO59292.1 quinone oxidoreductase, putative [Plasmodium berghei]SCO60310.1 quinone oxidoreductase, putative [Plasmodium berghei]|eukprot:XP_034420831.1 quinone oxidoreductase, putative [Plasmodium berghei ANKA]
MKGVILKGINELIFSESLTKPTLEKCSIKNQGNDLLLKVLSVGINRIDLLIKENKYPKFPMEKSLGLEISGIVEESNSNKFKKNDIVCSLLKYNGYNEYVLANSKHTMKIDANKISMFEAASIPESFLTAYKLIYYTTNFPLINNNDDKIVENKENIDTLNEKGDKNNTISAYTPISGNDCYYYKRFNNQFYGNYCGKNEVNVLVYGALSSVGINLLQLLNYEKKRNIMNINKIIAITSNERKAKIAMEFGATDYAFHNDNNFVENILNISKNVNLIFDCVGGGKIFENNLKICTNDTVWILYGLLGGPKVTNFNLAHLLTKRILLLTSTLYDRTDNYKEELIHSFQHHILPLIYNNTLKFCIHKVLPIEQIEEAHHIIKNNLNIGKVVCKF